MKIKNNLVNQVKITFNTWQERDEFIKWMNWVGIRVHHTKITNDSEHQWGISFYCQLSDAPKLKKYKESLENQNKTLP